MAWLRSLTITIAVLATLAAVGAAADRVNINTADAATLASVLNGVGLQKAKAIVRYRETNGRFDKPEDLAKVKGIGSATVAKNADRIVVRKADEGTNGKPSAKEAKGAPAENP